ncbi:MAG TPA: zinc ribbon domain-containing protein [Desulfomonilaceae bacterium]|nr:zinc ribbon domain-containing protein [Desulfomonilaceae bacterium]
MTKTVRIPVASFLSDFVSGEPDEALRKKYSLSPSEVDHVIAELKQRGTITSEDMAKRTEELRVRFGSADGPPDPANEGKAAVDLDTGWVLHCPSCGAPVRREAARCDYCNAALDFSLKGKTVNCPNCFAANPADARFCVRCARPITGLVDDEKIMEDRLCPRCEVPMRGKKIGEFSLVGCDRCAGVFVPHDIFEMMQEKRDSVVFSTTAPGKGEVAPQSNAAYVRCPVCRQIINRINFARISGVLVDVCKEHGIWFDGGEIEKIMDFIAHGGLQRAKQLDVERLKSEEEITRLRSGSPDASGIAASASWGDFRDIEGSAGLLKSLQWAFGLFKE